MLFPLARAPLALVQLVLAQPVVNLLVLTQLALAQPAKASLALVQLMLAQPALVQLVEVRLPDLRVIKGLAPPSLLEQVEACYSLKLSHRKPTASFLP